MLHYVGKASLPGIPARDLTDKEVERLGGAQFLINTGLYAKPEPPQKRTSKPKETAQDGEE